MTELEISQYNLEKRLDALRKELYSSCEPKLCHSDSVDVDVLGNVTRHKTLHAHSMTLQSAPVSKLNNLPPVGKFIYTSIKTNQSVYAMRSSLLAPWGRGRVIRVKIKQLACFEVWLFLIWLRGFSLFNR